MADIIAMFSRWANSGLSQMLSWVSSSFDGPASSSFEPILRNAKDDFQRIMRMLPRIEAVLADAEEREILDRSVDLWLSELRLLAYDIDDVVDEYEYEVLRSRVEAYHHGKLKRGNDDHHDNDEQGEHQNILASSSSQVPTISDGMAEKLRKIRERFDEIERDRKALRLREEDGVRQFVTPQRPQLTSSLVDESSIFGREGDKEKIMELLLSDLESNNNIQVCNKITVIPIVGMGGVGKTTLAQLIYNDTKILRHFDLRRWIYVSEDFDLVRLSREIHGSISNNNCGEDVGFDRLQESIKKELMLSKRTLLVLDDVWNEKQFLWESLKAPFHDAGIVSILVTTRNKKVANIMGTINPFHLDFLSEEEGWRLFQQRALCDDDNLMKIGHRIVQKCGGLPLAIKILGSHLRFERDEDKWMSILESELWELDPGASEILPALKLSYQRMPAHLKPCFRYCSMFPKEKLPKKNHLVWLWMAQGYIQHKIASKTIEEIGGEYFDELVGRSFFQPAGFNDNSFLMHDLIFDLAVSISNKEFITMTLEGSQQNKIISNSVRHLFLYDERTHNSAQEGNSWYPFLCRHVPLRSIFYYSQSIINDFQILDSRHLRALHIKIYEYDSNKLLIPDSITTLKHLRYLYMKIDAFCNLRLVNAFHSTSNLQVLDFFDCSEPIILSKSISNLINLRHLILPHGSFMPCEISRLTSLQTLKYVIVMDESDKCGGFSEIEDLESLTGSCHIYNISHATDVEGVKKANINKKRHIWRLYLDWSINEDFNDDSGFLYDVDICFDDYDKREEEQSFDDYDKREEEERFSDYEKIEEQSFDDYDEEEELSFDDYEEEEEEGGGGFDNYTNEDRQSSEMAEAILDALRPHNSLKELEIYNYPGVRFPLWLGDPSYSKLRDIMLHGCDEWDESCGVLDRDLPCLQNISIINCAKLKNIKLVQSSSVRTLCVEDCPKMTTMSGICNLHGLEELQIKRCPTLLISTEEKLPFKLKSVCFEDCWKLTSITGLHNLHSLEKLELTRCPKLQLSLDEQLSAIPGVVKVMDCPGLREFCQRYGFEFIQQVSQIEELTLDGLLLGSMACHVSLKTLYIQNLIESKLCEDEWIPCSLNALHLDSCQHLKFFPFYQNLSALRRLTIRNCVNLTYLPGLQMMESLEKLEIIECPQFTLSPVQRLPSKLQFLLISNCPRLMWLPGLQQLFSLRDLKLYECHNLMFLPLEQLPFMHQVQLKIEDCPKIKEWCRRYNLSYNNKESPKVLIGRSSQQVKLWLLEASILFGNICFINYDEAYLRNEKWPLLQFSGIYICSSVHLRYINLYKFNRLNHLRIWNCSSLEAIYQLSSLPPLQDMDISNCPNLHYLKDTSVLFCRFPSVKFFLKINKCPKLCLQHVFLPCPHPDVVEIRACPQLQKWCQENNIEYFQD